MLWRLSSAHENRGQYGRSTQPSRFDFRRPRPVAPSLDSPTQRKGISGAGRESANERGQGERGEQSLGREKERETHACIILSRRKAHDEAAKFTEKDIEGFILKLCLFDILMESCPT